MRLWRMVSCVLLEFFFQAGETDRENIALTSSNTGDGSFISSPPTLEQCSNLSLAWSSISPQIIYEEYFRYVHDRGHTISIAPTR